MVARLKEMWLVQEFKRGRLDGCAGPVSFETKEDAEIYAQDYADDVPYKPGTEHEAVIFKAVTSYRGNLEGEAHNVKPHLTTKEGE